MKYLQKPSAKAWQLYYEYSKGGTTYSKMGSKYGVTAERIRGLVTKVKKYLECGNTRILTEKQVEEILNKSLDIKIF